MFWEPKPPSLSNPVGVLGREEERGGCEMPMRRVSSSNAELQMLKWQRHTRCAQWLDSVDFDHQYGDRAEQWNSMRYSPP